MTSRVLLTGRDPREYRKNMLNILDGVEAHGGIIKPEDGILERLYEDGIIESGEDGSAQDLRITELGRVFHSILRASMDAKDFMLVLPDKSDDRLTIPGDILGSMVNRVRVCLETCGRENLVYLNDYQRTCIRRYISRLDHNHDPVRMYQAVYLTGENIGFDMLSVYITLMDEGIVPRGMSLIEFEEIALPIRDITYPIIGWADESDTIMLSGPRFTYRHAHMIGGLVYLGDMDDLDLSCIDRSLRGIPRSMGSIVNTVHVHLTGFNLDADLRIRPEHVLSIALLVERLFSGRNENDVWDNIRDILRKSGRDAFESLHGSGEIPDDVTFEEFDHLRKQLIGSYPAYDIDHIRQSTVEEWDSDEADTQHNRAV